jgi:RNA binding exosome subunit
MTLIRLIRVRFYNFTCAKTAHFLLANLVENIEQQRQLYTKQFSIRLDGKNLPYLETNHQQLIHRVIRNKYPVFTGQANVNNIFGLH